MAPATPTPEALAAVADGAMTVRQAVAFSGIGRTTLFKLMNNGTLTWFALERDRRITRSSLVAYMAALVSETQKRTPLPRKRTT